MRPYQYRCNDNSLLTPSFKKWIVAPLIKITPWIVPANIITILSNVFVYLGLVVALNPEWLGVYTPAATSLCLFLYLIGDHVDGMQAKRTGTGSALGEFCDHYLDAFNNGIVVFTLFTAFGINNPYFIACVMVPSYLAHMVVFYDQFKTGWLTFEKLGSLEAVLLSSILIGLSSFTPVYSFLTNDVVSSFSIIEMIMFFSGVGSAMTFLTTFKRIPDVNKGFWIFTGSLIVVAVLSVLTFDSFRVFVIITLYASLYIGRVMKAHLVDGIEKQTDFVTPALLVLSLAFAQSSTIDYAFWLILLYLLICIGTLIFQTFSSLRMYWVWSNERS